MNKSLKVSIITVCKNSETTIEKTIISVISQTYSNIEYIVIDGKSKDNTLKIIKKYDTKISKIISSDDKNFYDGLNKGIKISSGDLVGTLNSDDFLANNKVISSIVEKFSKNEAKDVIYGNVFYYKNYVNNLVRFYRVNNFSINNMLIGICAPHQTFYCKRELFKNIGFYKIDNYYKVISDFDFILRVLLKGYKFYHLDQHLVTMKSGGMSNKNYISIISNNYKIYKILKNYNLKVNLLKYLSKKFLKRIKEYRF